MFRPKYLLFFLFCTTVRILNIQMKFDLLCVYAITRIRLLDLSIISNGSQLWH